MSMQAFLSHDAEKQVASVDLTHINIPHALIISLICSEWKAFLKLRFIDAAVLVRACEAIPSDKLSAAEHARNKFGMNFFKRHLRTHKTISLSELMLDSKYSLSQCLKKFCFIVYVKAHILFVYCRCELAV